jgi:integrase
VKNLEMKGLCMKGKISYRKDRERYFITWYDKKRKQSVKIYNYLGLPLTSKDLAERLLAVLRSEEERGVLDLEKYLKGKTNVPSIIDEWLVDVRSYAKPGTIDSYECIAERHLKPFFENKPISVHEVDYKLLVEFLNQMEGKKSSKRLRMKLLRQVFVYAKTNHYIDTLPEFPKAHHYSDEQHEIRWLTEAEQLDFMRTFPEHDQAILLWLKYHFRRPSEACALQKSDYKDGVFYVRRTMVKGQVMNSTKTNEVVLVPCVKEYEPWVDWLRKQEWWISSPFFFINPKSTRESQHYVRQTLYAKWSRHCKRAGIQCSLYEGTKHSSSSQLVNEYGYNLHDVQLATAHKDLSSVRHYAKIDLTARRNALDKKLKVVNE